MASFRLSENLLKTLSEGAGYDAGGAATRGLANYQEQKKQRITDNQNQQTLDIQKQNAAATMENYKNQKENWATQNARISANDVITSTEAQRSNEANEEIEWAKLLADKRDAAITSNTWSEGQTDRLNDMIVATQEASGSAAEMSGLSKGMLEYDGYTGMAAKVLEGLQTLTGTQNSWSMMKTQYEGIINKLIVNGLPAGPASDKDIALIAKGFPSGDSNVKEISEYLGMLGRAQAGEAERMEHQRAFFEENKDLDGWSDLWKKERTARSLALSQYDEAKDSMEAEAAAEAAANAANAEGNDPTEPSESVEPNLTAYAKPQVSGNARGQGRSQTELTETKQWRSDYNAAKSKAIAELGAKPTAKYHNRKTNEETAAINDYNAKKESVLSALAVAWGE
jgi:hypothetical protein